MRRVRARVSVGAYRSGGRLRVYGPGATGTLDASAAMPTGSAIVRSFRTGEPTWCEGAWTTGPWCDERSYAGWCRLPWSIDEWCVEAARASVRSLEIEHGASEFAALAIDGIEQESGALTTGAALVVAAPAVPRVDSMAVASGLVTITVGDPIA